MAQNSAVMCGSLRITYWPGGRGIAEPSHRAPRRAHHLNEMAGNAQIVSMHHPADNLSDGREGERFGQVAQPAARNSHRRSVASRPTSNAAIWRGAPLLKVSSPTRGCGAASILAGLATQP